jgi:K+-transporting ATPase KdpF subunit
VGPLDWIAAIIGIAVVGYLVIALVHPEWF